MGPQPDIVVRRSPEQFLQHGLIARKESVRISLGTDAHHLEQFAFMELSLAAACLAKIPPERIINFMPFNDLKEWTASVRRSS